jgi:anti-sigma B factor antagonist
MVPFKLTENEISPLAREIRVEGELDLAVAAKLQEAISASAVPLVVIDLGGCEFIDSTGIAAIVQANRDRAEDGGRVVVHSAGAQVLRVLTITGLADNALVFPDRDAALASASVDESAQPTP